MALVVYNTEHHRKENFEPLDPKHVKMYCCGPTVYDLLHVGNFRGAIFYNFVRNWLEHLGYKVTYVYNYTDVDDKIIQKGLKDGISATEVAQKYTKEFQTDFARLKLRPHDLNPTVTESMPEIVDMIGELIQKEKAYAASGDVLYSIRAFNGYGKLSNRKPEELLEAVRIEKDARKKDPLDFALWKSAKPGEPSWKSPWGEGRPGWHIECSAMIRKHLGDQIDIHGGGMDLIFPHHENEIAQTEGCTGKPFVKYWLHNNMINLGGAKMSKSLGNIKTGRAFMEQYNAEILKYMLLSVHYRSVSDLSEDSVDHSIGGLARIYSAMALAESLLMPDAKVDTAFDKIGQATWTGITEAINDDFNTPEAMARIFEFVRQFNAQVKRGMKANPAVSGKALAFLNLVKNFGALLSLFQESPAQFLTSLDDLLLKKMKIERTAVNQLVQERSAARLNKDFAKSDELRKKLTEMGIAVSDLPEGSFWEVTK